MPRILFLLSLGWCQVFPFFWIWLSDMLGLGFCILLERMLFLEISMSLQLFKVFLLCFIILHLCFLKIGQRLARLLISFLEVFPAVQAGVDRLITHLNRVLYPFIPGSVRSVIDHVKVFTFLDHSRVNSSFLEMIWLSESPSLLIVKSIVFRPKISVEISVDITTRILWKLLRVHWRILSVIIWLLTVWHSIHLLSLSLSLGFFLAVLTIFLAYWQVLLFVLIIILCECAILTVLSQQILTLSPVLLQAPLDW